jgi:aspartate-semialdehyde dehydrogenase
MFENINFAVVGATGAVGEVMLSILSERNIPSKNIFPLASNRSLGKQVDYGNTKLDVIDLETFDFSNTQIGLFSAGASVSGIYAPKAANSGCVVIDNTSQFRYEDDIPLVISEVNPEKIAEYKNRGIIANPNCSTMQMLVALKPIYDAVGIKRINVATYQAVSGAGKEMIEDLAHQTSALLNGKPIEKKGKAKQIAFNAIPHIDKFLENRYTKEEMKMVWETQKILNDKNILVNPTAVRIPVFYGHSEAVHLETNTKINQADAVKLMNDADGVEVIDGVDMGEYPTAVSDGSGTDPVYVGRIREDISHENGLNLWIVADNIRKGAALNTVQIAEILIKEYL